MNIDIDRVRSSGPPSVITNGSSKTWRYPIVVMTTANNSVGRSSGRVTDLKAAQRPAPSMEAASYSWTGMVWSPARNRTIAKPRFRQAAITMSEGMARVGVPSQSGPSMPIAPRVMLSSP